MAGGRTWHLRARWFVIAAAGLGSLFAWAYLALALRQPSPPRRLVRDENVVREECEHPVVAVADSVWVRCSRDGSASFMLRLDLAANRAMGTWLLAGDGPLRLFVPRHDGGAIVLVGDRYNELEPNGDARAVGSSKGTVLGAAWDPPRGFQVAETRMGLGIEGNRVVVRTLASDGSWSARDLSKPTFQGAKPEAAFLAHDGWRVLYSQREERDAGMAAASFFLGRDDGRVESLGEPKVVVGSQFDEALIDRSRGHVLEDWGYRIVYALDREQSGRRPEGQMSRVGERTATVRWRLDEAGLAPLPERPAGAKGGLRADFVFTPDGLGLQPLITAEGYRLRWLGGRWLRIERSDESREIALADAHDAAAGPRALVNWDSLPMKPELEGYEAFEPALVPLPGGDLVLLDERGVFVRLDEKLVRVDPLPWSERISAALKERGGVRPTISSAWQLRGSISMLFAFPVLSAIAYATARLRRRPALTAVAVSAVIWIVLAMVVLSDYEDFLSWL